MWHCSNRAESCNFRTNAQFARTWLSLSKISSDNIICNVCLYTTMYLFLEKMCSRNFYKRYTVQHAHNNGFGHVVWAFHLYKSYYHAQDKEIYKEKDEKSQTIQSKEWYTDPSIWGELEAPKTPPKKPRRVSSYLRNFWDLITCRIASKVFFPVIWWLSLRKHIERVESES